ncbi:TRAP transporter small permease [Halomonas sp. IOP_14]|uniref:TRAP transporter small permease n=1 Tax=Halomonadaceae TaxID=28256 RepID=UPI0011419304|nr:MULTISPECIES: TRAP transporter small permease [Halomonas]MCD1587129.1 TRAP transporter small permease [Halomonas sp. IOP_14]
MSTPQHETRKGPASAGPIFDVLSAIVRMLASAGLITLTVLVVAEIGSRLLFNSSLHVVEELSGYLVIATTLFGASLAIRNNALFQVGFIYETLPPRVRQVLGLVYVALAMGICGVLAWHSSLLVMSSFARGNVAPTALMTPLWIPQMLLPVGLSVMTLFLLERALLQLGIGGQR